MFGSSNQAPDAEMYLMGGIALLGLGLTFHFVWLSFSTKS